MAKKSFSVAQGIFIPDVKGIHAAYEIDKGEEGFVFTVVLDAPRIPKLLDRYCTLLTEPGYFTLELPVQDSEAYDIYYVDGCTIPVLRAIVECHGQLLTSDGFVRFGFSSHDTPEQIYVGDLKTIQIYTMEKDKIEKLLHSFGLSEKPGCKKLWDILSDQNTCELIHVEVEEQSVFDLPDALADAGIYLAGRRED